MYRLYLFIDVPAARFRTRPWYGGLAKKCSLDDGPCDDLQVLYRFGCRTGGFCSRWVTFDGPTVAPKNNSPKGSQKE